MSLPLYLTPPVVQGHVYGTVEYDPGSDAYLITAEPAVMELAKRVFPGCRTKGERVKFKATTRAVGDLNWLMLRFPLTVRSPERFEADRTRAVEHALRRERNRSPVPITQAPGFTGKLYPYQEEGAGFLVANERCLLADDMGLGKTVTALAALAAAEAFPAIIVVPTNVQRQWSRMAGTFLDLPAPGQPKFNEDPTERGRRLCHIIKGLKPYRLPDTPLTIIHYGLLRGWKDELPERTFKAVVFDEIQELRHTGTDKYSAASLLAGSARYAWGLSGTPIYNYGAEIWTVTNILDFHCLGDRDSFTREWCSGYGSDRVTKPNILGDYLRREGLMIRRRKAEVQDQLPPKRRAVILVDNDESRYNAMIAEAVKLAVGYDQIRDWHQKGLTKRQIEGAARRAAGVAKAPYAGAFVRTLLEAGERVLLYAYHHDVHDTLAEVLKDFRPVQITGRETENAKQAAMDAFESGKTNLVQLSLRSTAGLDRLQGRGSCVVFAELDWSPAVHCLDATTEILTDRGFKGPDEVHVGDLVAAFNLGDGSIRFVPALRKADRLAGPEETFYRVRTKRIDLCVTGQHRLVVRSNRRMGAGRNGPPWGVRQRSEWTVERASELEGVARRFVPTAGHEAAPGVPLSDDELRLIGLFLSDGSFNGRTLTVYQSSHQPWNTDIVRILDGAGMSWQLFKREAPGRIAMNQYHIPAGIQPRWTAGEVARLWDLRISGASYRQIAADLRKTDEAVYRKWRKIARGQMTQPAPEKPRKGWMALAPYLDKNLSPLLETVTAHQLECLIQGLFLGDGAKNGIGVRRITNTNRAMLDRVQSLCVRRGRSANLSQRKAQTTAGNRLYDLYISDATDAYLQVDGEGRFKADPEPATGHRVWCVENEVGTIVIRRNGKVAIVGNSQCEDRLHRIGVDSSLDSILCYYLVSDTGSDETMQEALGLKVGQFVGLMGDQGETERDRAMHGQAVERHLDRIIERLKQRGAHK
jgi:SWI/SNF-related matrix-associated actin-dependent regulator of chromatin subfamily A-like protein 1